MWVQLWEQTLTGSAFNAPITTPIFLSDKKILCVQRSVRITYVFIKITACMWDLSKNILCPTELSYVFL